MSRNFTDYLTMGVKYLEAVKRRLHATKQWSPDEIRVWQIDTAKFIESRFNMPAQTITPELQKDLKLLKVGTVVDSPLDFFSGRLTKKKRKARLADEVLSDQNLAAYRKRKVREIEEQNRPAGNEKWKIKGSNSRRHKL
ncbi:hypothetical protein D0Y65_038455 [Glycine soja]|uniref:Fcf2 pre-rRNA processing C-terminal domain-containing protein n=1 Tax=Glycine soja TaxID=3848 RepID=A0A445H4V4_GLYSO|nr:hypothetical protein D0Y65_038455 [Glycine soja]